MTTKTMQNLVTIPFTDAHGTTYQIEDCYRLATVLEVTEADFIELHPVEERDMLARDMAQRKRLRAGMKFYAYPGDFTPTGTTPDRFYLSFTSVYDIAVFNVFPYVSPTPYTGFNPVFLHDGGLYASLGFEPIKQDYHSIILLKTLTKAGWRFTDSF